MYFEYINLNSYIRLKFLAISKSEFSLKSLTHVSIESSASLFSINLQEYEIYIHLILCKLITTEFL